MKLTEEQKKDIRECWGDWEVVHGRYDDLVYKRLKELDPEFVEELDKLIEGASFWYA